MASTDDVVAAIRSLQRAYLIGVEGVTEIWLVRHADVYDQRELVSDPPLSPLGHRQANRLAQRLKSIEIRAVYASPLRRAQQTAAALTAQVTTDPRLTEVRAAYPDGKVELQESHDAVIGRMQAAVSAAAAAHPGGRIVMVSHGIAILTYLCDVLGLTPGTLRLFPDFTSVSVVRVKGERRMAGSLCDTAHLVPVGMTDAEERIRTDLAAQIRQPVHAVRAIPEGHSGFTYWVELDGHRGVLRLPPPGARIAGPADIPRQARIMAALHGQGLPVPAIVATSQEPVVDGRPFVLMEAVAGDRVEQAIDAGSNPLQLASSAVDVLRQFQAVPLQNTGIGGEDPMPLEGEVARWTWLMDRAPAELTGHAPRLAQLLAERQPQPGPPVLVHGDYHFGNMLFDHGRVAAVVDWEIAELGQPLLDLCCISLSHVSADAVREMSGADSDDYRWYRALTLYKYAAIFGYNLMLHRRGKRPDPSYEQRTDTILGFIDQGVGVLG